MEFNLNNQAYIQLNQLLKFMGIAESGGDANDMITSGFVTVNGQVATEKRKKLYKGDVCRYENDEIKVS